ncbi:thiol reductant ABC exporter subunit CydC [Salsuginibacillus kocurii]|uniref:thiol reductant ABC exporter subunit CydC n=1 Tax=Salsuginibacillus kocurii TaxID=427078 RepID=UPI000379FDE8|nr:thiol reductant ABC exporter subunit CydC [Salsuginibacillus kocurii]
MQDLITVTKILLRERKDVWLSIVFGSLAGLAAVGLFASSGYLISEAALTPPLYTLTLMIVLIEVFGVSRAGTRYVERLVSHRATFKMLANVRTYFYERLVPKAATLTSSHRSGELLARVVGDVETLQHFFLRVLYPPLVMAAVFICTLLFSAYFSPWIALILVAGLLVSGFVLPGLFALSKQREAARLREIRGQLGAETTEYLSGFRDLKIHQQLEKKEAQVLERSYDYMEKQAKETKRRIFQDGVQALAANLVTWLVVLSGAYLVITGDLHGVYLAMLVMISIMVFETAVPMATFANYSEESWHAASRLFSVAGNDAGESSPAAEKVTEPFKKAPAISAEQVAYTFAAEPRPAIRDVSVQLPAGSKTAVVGPSGSGKSVLLHVLAGVYPAEQGKVDYDDIPLAAIAEDARWASMNMVLQANHFFYGTIRDNLRIANEKASPEEMLQALRNVQLEHMSLSAEVQEKGANLSGGEKQRLALARTFLKKAPLWLLDEPFSSLDSWTTRQLKTELFTKAAGGTLLLVSHSLTGLEEMDQILVMEAGKVVEAGHYDALIAKKGYFYELKAIEDEIVL